MGSTETDGTMTLPASGDPNVPALSTEPGHATTGGRQSASSGSAPFDRDDAQLALDWINRELDKGIVVPSEPARARREILKRQKAELEARL